MKLLFFFHLIFFFFFFNIRNKFHSSIDASQFLQFPTTNTNRVPQIEPILSNCPVGGFSKESPSTLSSRPIFSVGDWRVAKVILVPC